jgi:shikimate dehydrogenase
MQNAAFAALGLNFVYLPFQVSKADLAAAVAGLRALGLAGANVTVPHKEAVLPYLDEVAEEARLIGAVNTIVNRGGRLKGYNTDGTGFLRAAVEAGFEPRGAAAVILGAGGAARAVSFALALAGARRIAIFNRTYARAEALAEEVSGATGVWAAALPWDELAKCGVEVMGTANIVVQTTSLGMHPQEAAVPPVPANAFRKEQLVVDLVYNPPRTEFLRLAEECGARTENGLGMLLYQGAAALELWTGQQAPVAVMREALERVLGQR